MQKDTTMRLLASIAHAMPKLHAEEKLRDVMKFRKRKKQKSTPQTPTLCMPSSPIPSIRPSEKKKKTQPVNHHINANYYLALLPLKKS